MRYITFVLHVAPAMLLSGGEALRTRWPGLQVLRGLGMVGSALLFTAGLRFLGVADATAIYFVSPLLITALSIPLLGEVVDWRRWTAALIGLAGVLIVIRPGTGAFDATALFPLLGAMCWAGAVIVTRKMSGADHPVTTMAYSALVGALVLTAFLPFNWDTPSWSEVGLGICIGLLSTAGHWLVVLAYRQAHASLIAPYGYVQLSWARLFGFAVFGSLPDALTLTGAGVIAASGLYTTYHERARNSIGSG